MGSDSEYNSEESDSNEIALMPEELKEQSNVHLSFKVLGTKDLPLIEVTMAPNSKLTAEPGRMISMDEGVEFTVCMGNGKEAGVWEKLKAAGSRMLSGENLLMARFKNTTDDEQIVRFGTVVPGNLLHLRLEDYGGSIIGMGGVFLIGSYGQKIKMCFQQKIGAAFFGGESFILQRISGEGEVILQAGGAILKQELTPERPTIRVDTGCLVAFTENLEYNVALAGSFKSMLFAGEGLFHTTVTLKPGEKSGTVWLESFPYSKFISYIKRFYSH
eukprot:TRINITY_DN94922_c0_g1_i1.p1 TRINITY_DN94922_c0_g1~~TRINITY_DN94922_c0_g1_i1.p1  ORF type:complete len:273 (+),score=32.70 TRINITY_DN94922_c0_g1_i1:90-908(+)